MTETLRMAEYSSVNIEMTSSIFMKAPEMAWAGSKSEQKLVSASYDASILYSIWVPQVVPGFPQYNHGLDHLSSFRWGKPLRQVLPKCCRKRMAFGELLTPWASAPIPRLHSGACGLGEQQHAATLVLHGATAAKARIHSVTLLTSSHSKLELWTCAMLRANNLPFSLFKRSAT